MPFLLVRVDPAAFRATAISEMRSLLEEHPGGTPVVVAVRTRRLLLAERFNAEASTTLTTALQRLGADVEVRQAEIS